MRVLGVHESYSTYHAAQYSPYKKSAGMLSSYRAVCMVSLLHGTDTNMPFYRSHMITLPISLDTVSDSLLQKLATNPICMPNSTLCEPTSADCTASVTQFAPMVMIVWQSHANESYMPLQQLTNNCIASQASHVCKADSGYS